MNIKKIIKIQGTSNVSFEDAINSSLSEASKSIDNITKLCISNLCCNISDNKISEYIVDVDIVFTVDLERINK